MAQIIHGTASWPGVVSVEACQYTISHGITPGTAILRCQPQAALPAQDGTLVISDGNTTIALPGCRLDALKIHQGDDGLYWTLEIVDRRWRWRDLGLVNGCYNQLDPFGKLIPWTIRSSEQLATQCLVAMGETNFIVNLPPGLSYPGPFVTTPIVNVTGTNPPVNWEGVPPAQALSALADQYGARVIYRWSDDTILVTPVGEGDGLPGGSIHAQGPSLKNVETPDAIGVMGSPTRYQCRLQLVAVGQEWDGSYRPIDLLSYAPKLQKGAVQIESITITNPTSSVIWTITLQVAALVNETINVDSPSSTPSDSYTAIANAINGNPSMAKVVIAASTGSAVTVTGKTLGQNFTLIVDPGGTLGSPPATITAALTQAPQKAAANRWQYSMPPLFPNVVPTDRLTLQQARGLAQASVFRCYAVANISPDDSPGITVPGVGRLIRREQLVLQDTQVDQITPQPGDNAVRAKGFPQQPFVAFFYTGYSKDKPAVCFASIANYLNNGVYYQNAPLNTPEGSQIFVPFTVDPVRYMVTFSKPIWVWEDGGMADPEPVLETAVLVRDPVTNQINRFLKLLPLGGTSMTNPRIYQHPDVQANVTCDFDDDDMPEHVQLLEADPILRANSYLAAHLQEYQLSGGQVLEYNGIVAIDLDGAIQQVTWSVGPDGATTTASRNTEHSVWIPPYPTRRRAEFLPPALSKLPQAKVADMAGGVGGAPAIAGGGA